MLFLMECKTESKEEIKMQRLVNKLKNAKAIPQEWLFI